MTYLLALTHEASGDPTDACQNLLTTLSENYNLRRRCCINSHEPGNGILGS